MSKIEFINKYIEKCDNAINLNNSQKAKELQKEIIGIFQSEITDIKNGLDNYSGLGLYDINFEVNYIADIKLLREKLLNYVENINEEKEKREYELELARFKQQNISANAEVISNQSVTTNYETSITNTIELINNISKEKLSDNDKKTLQEYIYTLDGIKNTKDKNKFWEKTKDVLHFIADKCADAAIAILPYIISGLN